MSSYSPDIVLEEMRDNSRRALDWVGVQTAAQLAADERTLYAVVRCLEIVSEASRRLPDDVKLRHPSIPWRNVADAGNAYRHVYHDIDPQIIWSTVALSLPTLLAVIEAELASGPASTKEKP